MHKKPEQWIKWREALLKNCTMSVTDSIELLDTAERQHKEIYALEAKMKRIKRERKVFRDEAEFLESKLREQQSDRNIEYFANTKCEYYPCHKMPDDGPFDCLFCYCPLYPLDCGGKYKLLANGLKDCSDCIVPHRPANKALIIDKLIKTREGLE